MPTPDTSVNPEVESDVELISDEELDAKRDEVEELRAELSRIESERLAKEQAKANSSTYTQLESEGDRLRALIAAAKGTQPDIGQEAAAAEQNGVTAEQVGQTGFVPTADGEKMGTVPDGDSSQSGSASPSAPTTGPAPTTDTSATPDVPAGSDASTGEGE